MHTFLIQIIVNQYLRKYYLIGILLFLTFFEGFSQSMSHDSKEMIVQLERETDINSLITHFSEENTSELLITHKEVLSDYLNIHLLNITSQNTDSLDLIQNLSSFPSVLNCQFNRSLQQRGLVPNDTSFKEQWALYNDGSSGGTAGADINISKLWNINTGGLSADGDTIVIAVVDDGINDTHPDLQQNIWFNYHEIPGNFIDDDSNGYTDDYRGWNTYTDNDEIFYDGNHGTQVSGIIGARGNNITGISGINWNVKIMMIVGGGQESDAIKAYSYVLAMRRLYNKSKGKKGAYIVSVNSSWGLDSKFPKDAPIWCALYDSMGKNGIVNVAATTNSERNVDTDGDLPTTCPSKYLISVTSTNKNDQRVNSGYGKINIDIGAPGKSVYTTATTFGGNADYSYFTGTSGASPHVAGVLGLLYASACKGLIQIGKKYPDSLALLMKSFVLDGAKPLGSLYNYTLTGGRLDAFSAYLKMNEFCNKVLSNPDIATESTIKVFPNPVTHYIVMENIPSEIYQINIVDLNGKTHYIFNHAINESSTIMEVSFLPEGIYFIYLYGENSFSVKKFLKI